MTSSTNFNPIGISCDRSIFSRKLGSSKATQILVNLSGVPVKNYTATVFLALADNSPLAYLAAKSSKVVCLILLAFPAVPKAS